MIIQLSAGSYQNCEVLLPHPGDKKNTNYKNRRWALSSTTHQACKEIIIILLTYFNYFLLPVLLQGTLESGQVFDTSLAQGRKPINFELGKGQVIKG